MRVTDVITAPGTGEKEALLLAGAVEDASEHPIGQAIAREAAARFGGLPPVTGFAALPGPGVQGRVKDRTSPSAASRCSRSCPWRCPAALRQAVTTAGDAGRTAVLAGWHGQARAALMVADDLRPGAPAAVARLRGLGLRPVLLTGDNERAARAVAGQLGIPADSVLAGVRPEGKAQVIREMQADGWSAVFVGDGVNDAAALAQADLGMAAGTGTDAAIGAADVTLVGGDLSAVADADRARPCHDGRHPGKPRLGVRLQRDRDTARRAWLPQPPIRRDCHVRQLADRRRQQPAAAPLHPPVAARRGAGGGTVTAAGAGSVGGGHGWLGDLVRSAAGPVICAAVVTGLLSAWAATGGAGTLTRVRLQVTLAAVPMRAYLPRSAAAVGAAHVYLTVRNLTGTPDELIAVRSPIARDVVLTRRDGPGSQPVVIRGLTVPARGTLNLSPLTDDIVLEDPAPFENSAIVPLTLVFRHAGQVTIEASVTAPGAP